MLLEIYLVLTIVTFIFMILSFIPLGERRRSVRVSEGEEIKEESQSFVVIFPWIAMGLFFILAFSSMDITIVSCENVVTFADGSVTDNITYTNSWSCDETQYFNGPLAWLFVGLGTIMLVYSILATLLWSAGSLVVEVKKLTGSNN